MTAIDFPCPVCAAEPGEECETLSGMPLKGWFHPARPTECGECERVQNLPAPHTYRACGDCEDGTAYIERGME